MHTERLHKWSHKVETHVNHASLRIQLAVYESVAEPMPDGGLVVDNNPFKEAPEGDAQVLAFQHLPEHVPSKGM